VAVSGQDVFEWSQTTLEFNGARGDAAQAATAIAMRRSTACFDMWMYNAVEVKPHRFKPRCNGCGRCMKAWRDAAEEAQRAAAFFTRMRFYLSQNRRGAGLIPLSDD
jgi:heterodisulfide reductase subunit A-like polyferredoxin